MADHLGVVPDEISAWNPDTPPQAMVMKRTGTPGHRSQPLPGVGAEAGMLTFGASSSVAPQAGTPTSAT